MRIIIILTSGASIETSRVRGLSGSAGRGRPPAASIRRRYESWRLCPCESGAAQCLLAERKVPLQALRERLVLFLFLGCAEDLLPHVRFILCAKSLERDCQTPWMKSRYERHSVDL